MSSHISTECPNCKRVLRCYWPRPIKCSCGTIVDDSADPCERPGEKQVPLGDLIERRLGKFGLWYKRTFKRLTGKDCGCDKRKQRLNEWSRSWRAWRDGARISTLRAWLKRRSS